jgi:hypothetical protein
MGALEDVIKYLRGQVGVIEVFKLDDNVSAAIDTIEKSIKTRTNHDYINKGCEYSLTREHRVCILFTKDFRKKWEFYGRLHLVTSDGTILGTNVYPNEIEEYKERDDVIFVSEDFVVFPDVKGCGEESFVLYPYDFNELQEVVPGCHNAIGFFPAPSSDHYLKELMGVDDTQYVFSTIIAFDSQDPDE